MQSLAQHGLTITDAKAEILELVVRDYYKGPKQDFNPDKPGDIWEFKKIIAGRLFYIKAKNHAGKWNRHSKMSRFS